MWQNVVVLFIKFTKGVITMIITDKHKEQVESIISEMKSQGHPCVKDFECYTSKFEKLCKIKGIGSFDDIECDSEDAKCCEFSFIAFSKRFCKCPLRRYISENFHK